MLIHPKYKVAINEQRIVVYTTFDQASFSFSTIISVSVEFSHLYRSFFLKVTRGP